MFKSLPRYLVYLMVFSCLACCSPKPVPRAAITIDGIGFSVDEFEREFQQSVNAKVNTPDSRKEFLEIYIAKKLVIRAAEKQGIDKDPVFLKEVEDFWQQRLFKLAIDRSSRDMMGQVKVTPEEKTEYYDKYKERYFKDRPFEEVQGDITAVLLKQKRQAGMDEWLTSLRKQMNVKVDYKELGIEQDN